MLQMLSKNLKIHNVYMKATAVVPRVPRFVLLKVWWQEITDCYSGKKEEKEEETPPNISFTSFSPFTELTESS